MKHILIGNGFNIQLGGEEYLNKAIIRRAFKNAKEKNYGSVFKNDVTNEDIECVLLGIYKELSNILKGEYEKVCSDTQSKELIQILKRHYSNDVKRDEIGMEDYFIILRLYHKKYDDPQDLIDNMHIAFSYLFLDAIYNEGKIQKIADRVEEKNKEYLKEKLQTYDSVYTVNYDCNVEKIANREVKYLHGDFNTLLDQYKKNTIMGYAMEKQGKFIEIEEEWKHIYSTALIGFKGSHKEQIMERFENQELGLKMFYELYKNGMTKDDLNKLEELRKSKDTRMRLVYDLLVSKIENPNFSVHKYPINEFREIEGEIELLGISPSNDEHIWKAILENNSISKIVYYYHSTESRREMEELYSDDRIVYKSDNEFWYEVFI